MNVDSIEEDKVVDKTRLARLIIQSLGDSGQPPKYGARYLNVATDGILERLRSEYLLGHCAAIDGEDGIGACKWIEADFGNGKTQFLTCVQEIAWDLGYVTAFVELHQDECPLDRAERLYGAVARNLHAKPTSIGDVDRMRGIDHMLAQLVDRKFPGVLTGLPNPEVKSRALMWVRGLQSIPVESVSYRKAVEVFLQSKLTSDTETENLASMYLRGENLPAATLKKIGVFEKIDKSTGFRMMRSLCQLLQRSGIAQGTVLLFDEARRSLSLMSTRAQKVACENLLSVINKCNSGDWPGVLFLYAVMPEFFTNFATNYPALQQRCGKATRIDLNIMAGITEIELLEMIGKKVAGFFADATGCQQEQVKPLESDLKVLADACVRKSMGTGTRRMMVKAWVQRLRECEGVTSPSPLTRETAEDLLEGVDRDLKIAESEELHHAGE